MSESTNRRGSHVPWGSIELLHNLVATLGHLNGLGQPFPVVEYRAKVKLHGTNCAVQITSGGVVAQSRTALLSPFDGSLRVDAIHEDTRFTQETTAAVEAEIEALASWLGLTVER